MHEFNFIYNALSAIAAVLGAGVTAVGIMIGYTIVVSAAGFIFEFFKPDSDLFYPINIFGERNYRKKDYHHAGIKIITSPIGLVAVSVSGLIFMAAIFQYIVSLPHSRVDYHLFLTAIVASFLSLGFSGFLIGLLFSTSRLIKWLLRNL